VGKTNDRHEQDRFHAWQLARDRPQWEARIHGKPFATVRHRPAGHSLRPGYAQAVPRPDWIELGEGRDRTRIRILYEDRTVLAIDKPAGWMLVPFTWQTTRHNLAAALASSIRARDFWARSRNLKCLRNVHRLDADTTGILLFVKHLGAVRPYSDLFKSRQMEKLYLAVVRGVPVRTHWSCREPIGRDPHNVGRRRIDRQDGQQAETSFTVHATGPGRALVEARPVTGRTHQIRLHLQHAGHPILGDALYGTSETVTDPATANCPAAPFPLALRAVALAYSDPFLRQPVRIRAPREAFLRAFGFLDAATQP
jgi:23S rRNA pseudouridine1911/1915/1917 synthase